MAFYLVHYSGLALFHTRALDEVGVLGQFSDIFSYFFSGNISCGPLLELSQ